MQADADAHAPLGLTTDVVAQVQGNDQRVSLVTHSWGSMPTELFVAKHPVLVDRINVRPARPS
jgi:pimeloyl-ACP methyl ester carboxylesterase